jgi:hypothetical protein
MTRTERRRLIIAALRDGHRTPRDVAAVTGINAASVGNVLVWLCELGVVVRYNRGRYRLPIWNQRPSIERRA